MIPSVGLLKIGNPSWTLPLPLPVFLAWPLIAIALGGVVLMQRVVDRQGASFSRLALTRVALRALFQLSGLKIDVRSTEGTRITMWLL